MTLKQLLSIISRDIMFEFDANKKIGHVRCQFGENSLIANQFFPYPNIDEKVKKYGLDLKRADEVCRVIQFE